MLEIGIEALFRVQFWAITGQVEQFNFVLMLFDPLLDWLAVMHAQMVENYCSGPMNFEVCLSSALGGDIQNTEDFNRPDQ